MSGDLVPRASLELTHILYDPTSLVSLGMAIISLSPILLMPVYAALVVQTREVLLINMWAGQLACEGVSWLIKRVVKQDRPVESIGNGYGFPSSHSQWMGYFASFLMMHLYFRHRFASTGSGVVDHMWRGIVYLALATWAGLVCYSRYYLLYHTPFQVLAGVGIGIVFGCGTYTVFELVPAWYPGTILGKVRTWVLGCSVGRWVRVRDGWAVWEDGGREEEWRRWWVEWEKRNRGKSKTM